MSTCVPIRKCLASACALGVILACRLAGAEPTALLNVQIVDLRAGRVSPAQIVVWDAGRIVAAGPATEVPMPAGARVIDASNKYAMPGLWDMHVHLSTAGEFLAPVLLAKGVTHARDMGGPFKEVFRLRREIAAGERLGPHIFAAGPILESSRWIERAKGFLTPEEMSARLPAGPTETAGETVDHVLQLGADFVKFRSVDSREIYFALAAATRARGVALVGHAPPPAISLIEAAEAGQRSFEHYIRALGIQPLPDDLAPAFAAFRRSGAHFVPTLVSGVGFRLTPDDRADALIADDAGTLDSRRRYVPAALVASWKAQMEMKRSERVKQDWARIHAENIALFRKMHEAGLRIMAGTDLAGPLVYPGFSLHDELAMFVKDLGMSPVEALRAATIVPAEFMGVSDVYGSVETGKAADFLLLDRDPLIDIANTRAIAAVVAAGRYLSREELDRLLAQAQPGAANHVTDQP